MNTFVKATTILISWFVAIGSTNAADQSVWKVWQTLKSSWGSSSFSLQCNDITYMVSKPVFSPIAISSVDGDGNWKEIENAQFSDTSVVWINSYLIDGRYFYEDVKKSKSVQLLLEELQSESKELLNQEASKLEIVRAKDKHLAEAALAQCKDRSIKKYRPFVEQETKLLYNDNPDLEEKIEFFLGVRVNGACEEYIRKLLVLESSKNRIEQPTPIYEVAVDSSNRQISATLNFQSGERSLQVLDWPTYKIRITVGNYSKEQEGALSPLDEIHGYRDWCTVLK